MQTMRVLVGRVPQNKTHNPVNRDIKMALPCQRYRNVYTWQISSIRHIINIPECETLGGCRLPRHIGE
jgi:hypothetical protein